MDLRELVSLSHNKYSLMQLHICNPPFLCVVNLYAPSSRPNKSDAYLLCYLWEDKRYPCNAYWMENPSQTLTFLCMNSEDNTIHLSQGTWFIYWNLCEVCCPCWFSNLIFFILDVFLDVVLDVIPRGFHNAIMFTTCPLLTSTIFSPNS